MGGPARGSAPAAQVSAAPLTSLALRDVQMVSGRGASRQIDARSPRGVEQGAGIRNSSKRLSLEWLFDWVIEPSQRCQLLPASRRRGYLHVALRVDRSRPYCEFPRRRASRRRGIYQALKQPVESLAVLFDGGTFAVCQRNQRQSPIDVNRPGFPGGRFV